jgi:hypothetical protein
MQRFPTNEADMSESSAEDAIAAAHRVALAALREQAMAWVKKLGPDATAFEPGAIAKNDGVIDAFNIAAQIVLRVIEKEREAHRLAAASERPQHPYEQELDRLIAEELDRIATDRGPAAFAYPVGMERENNDAGPLGLEELERAA